jgi:hypothetical protein
MPKALQLQGRPPLTDANLNSPGSSILELSLRTHYLQRICAVSFVKARREASPKEFAMMSRWWLAAVWVCLLFLLPLVLSAQITRIAESRQSTDCTEDSRRSYMVCPGAWSGKTISLFNTWMASDGNPDRQLDLPSPDGKKVIEVRGFHVRLNMNGKRCWTPFGSMHDAEMGWAPDSTRLFVTWSESGALGPWHTQVYTVTETGLVEIPGGTRRVRPDMLLRMRRAPLPKWVDTREKREMWGSLEYCADDVVGAQWLNGSDEILVAAMAGPDSGCKYMGDFVVYRIEVATGKILQTYSPKDAHRIFGNDDLPRIVEDDDEL